MIDATQATTSFLLGLSGAGHCLGMCGGIAAALNLGGPRSPTITFAYHSGRIASYALLGALLGFAAASIDIAAWTIGLGGYGTECFYLGADDAAVRAGYIARYAVDQLWGGASAGVAATARIKSGDRFTAYRLGVMDAVYHCCT
jgi:hypothetical protein